MIKVLPLIKLPVASLRIKSSKLALADIKKDDIQRLIDNMIATMYDAEGIGIAAPQVGLNIRLIIISHNKEPLALINPKIIKRSWRKDIQEEGCLSIPGLYGPVKRSLTVFARALGRGGNELNIKLEGLSARIIQHEIDHLDGILFVDRAREIKRVNIPTGK